MKVVRAPRVGFVSPSARCALGGALKRYQSRCFTQVVKRAAFIVLTSPVRGPFAGPGWGACRFRFRLVLTNYVCLVSC